MAVRDEELSRKRLIRAALVSVFALVVVAGSGLQAVAADDEDDEPFEEKMLKSLMGADKPVIEYRERSPLVVPPARDLPPPENSAAAQNPAWPKDPDVQARKEAIEALSGAD